jgi:hypothetical protein
LKKVLLAILLAAASVSPAHAALCDDLQGYWHVEEGRGQTVADSSLHAVSGHLNHADRWEQGGKLGQCVNFRGDTEIVEANVDEAQQRRPDTKLGASAVTKSSSTAPTRSSSS